MGGEPSPVLDEEGRTKAAELLGGLADLTGDAEALEARRREAAAFDPDAALVDLYLDLLAVERDPEGARETFEELEAFTRALGRERRAAGASRLMDGLARLEAEEPLHGPRARRLREAVAAAFAAARGEGP